MIQLQQMITEEDGRKDERVFEPLEGAKQLDIVHLRFLLSPQRYFFF